MRRRLEAVEGAEDDALARGAEARRRELLDAPQLEVRGERARERERETERARGGMRGGGGSTYSQRREEERV